MEKDLILVTFNYRFGPFGFLSLEDESLGVPGNCGLKDQVMALKWIKKNIYNFGGDTENITLAGHSAGAGSVHFLCISEKAKGLFHRAIIMSGSSFCKSWSFIPRSHCKKFALILAQNLGWENNGDTKEMLEFLENASAFEIVKVSMKVLSNEDEFGDGVVLPFAPCIEPYDSENCLIPKDPVLMARDAWSNEIDVVFTGCSFEGILRAFMKEEVAAYYFQTSPAYYIPLIEFDLQPTDPIAVEYGERIKKLYYADEDFKNQENFLRYSSDFAFWHGVYRAILSRLKFASGKTFLMRFHVDASLNMHKIIKKCLNYKGASHVDDLFYLFKTNYTEMPQKDSKEFKVIENMVGIFSNFSISGSPNFNEIKFTPQNDANNLKCVQMTENDVVEIELPELKSFKVWDSIYEDHDVPLY